MALNVCAHCTAKFAIGVPHCPQCGNADYYEEGSMAKISRHGGATHVGTVVAAVVAAAAEAAAAEVEDREAGTEPEDEPTEPDGPYGFMLRAQLQKECTDRGLPTSGSKAELVARLAAADEAVAEAEADE